MAQNKLTSQAGIIALGVAAVAVAGYLVYQGITGGKKKEELKAQGEADDKQIDDSI